MRKPCFFNLPVSSPHTANYIFLLDKLAAFSTHSTQMDVSHHITATKMNLDGLEDKAAKGDGAKKSAEKEEKKK